MAVNETIVTGRKFRRLIDESAKRWQRISWSTSSADVEFNDRKTAEQKIGNINGITSDLNNERTDLAASANAVCQVNRKFGGMRFDLDEHGNPIVIITGKDGADTVIPFNRGLNFSNSNLKVLISNASGWQNIAGESSIKNDTTGIYMTCQGTSARNRENPKRTSKYFFSPTSDFIPGSVSYVNGSTTVQERKVTAHGEWVAMKFSEPVAINVLMWYARSILNKIWYLEYADEPAQNVDWYDPARDWKVAELLDVPDSVEASPFGNNTDGIIINANPDKHRYWRFRTNKAATMGKAKLLYFSDKENSNANEDTSIVG